MFVQQSARLLSRSAHQTPNFTNPEFQFPQFRVLQSFFVFIFLILPIVLAFLGVFRFNLRLLSGKNIQKVN